MYTFKIITATFFLTGYFFTPPISAQPKDSLTVIPLTNTKLSGYTGKKVDRCIEQSIMSADVSHFVEPFRHRNETRQWQTEFWGKWFTAAAQAYQYNRSPQLKTLLDKAVSDLISTQTADGYIGNYKQENRLQQWDIWGRKYCLLGLLAYHKIEKDKKSLEAARRLADHLMQEVKASGQRISQMGNHRGMAASSVLEPIVALYNVTHDKKYLAFAEEIVASWEVEKDPGLISKAIENIPVAHRFPKPKNWWTWEQGQKAYEMMSCYEGLLELYRITGNPVYRSAVEKTAENIRTTEIMITGSGGSIECWFEGAVHQAMPAVHTMETCITATWMKLCLQLLRTTGDVKWAHEIERTFYNSLAGAMTPDGASWSKYSEFSGYRHFGEKQCGMDLNCCIASGPRGMMVVPQVAIMQNERGPVINLFASGQSQLKLQGGNVSIKVSTEYPKSAEVAIDVIPEKITNFDLQVRIPQWSTHTTISVNGQALPKPEPGKYAHISRAWNKEDKVMITLDMQARVIPSADDRFFALQYGPLVLAADQRLEQQQHNEFLEPRVNKDGIMPVTVIEHGNPEIYFTVKVPFKTKAVFDEDTELILCDYASAGNTWSKKSAFQVWFPRLLDIRENNEK